MMKFLFPILMLLSTPLMVVQSAQADDLDGILDYLVAEREMEMAAEERSLEEKKTEIARSRARLAEPRENIQNRGASDFVLPSEQNTTQPTNQ